MNGVAFQRSTMTSDEEPIPRANRPGASSAKVAACMASSPGPRVYTGTTAVPSLSRSLATAASANGVKPSALLASPVHTSV
jgi:hypothetical protein